LVAQNRFDEARAIYRTLLAKEPANSEIGRKFELLENLAGTAAPPTPASPRSGIAPARQPFLIAVGSGIGDMLHTTPLIRNIARRMEAPLDVLVLADHPGSEFLMRNREYVNAVWPVTPEALNRAYDTVFLTHSFGPTRFALRAKSVRASREWQRYRPGRLNDTIFNLEAAKQLLGIDHDEGDAEAYFVGDLAYRRPAEALVGLHAGSKRGRWLSKRWPYFPELAARLTARGFRVASLGTADEYVEGTENRTGGTIEEMCRSMLECTHFVSNDSGPMHIASALGIPVLALFAPTDPMSHLPLCRTTVALALDRVCAPCEVKDHGHFASGLCQCIRDVDVATVERKVLDLIFRQSSALMPQKMNVGGQREASGETS
jgi:ADP-heptose:LPS heptosyltransferase